MTIRINNELRDRAFNCACKHGFHDKEYSDEHWIMLIITEISEAVNADRKGKYANIKGWEYWIKKFPIKNNESFISDFECYVKDTVEDELADVVIRCLDFAGLRNFNVCSVSYGDDEITLTESMFGAVKELIVPPKVLVRQYQIDRVISEMFGEADRLGINLLWHIEQKMKYNELRPMLNGKKY